MINYIIDTEFDADRCGDVRKCYNAQLLQIGILKFDTKDFSVVDTIIINIKPQHPVSKNVQEFLGIGEDGFTENAVNISRALDIMEEFLGVNDEYYDKPINEQIISLNSYGMQDSYIINMEYGRLHRHRKPFYIFGDVNNTLKPKFILDFNIMKYYICQKDNIAQAEVYEWVTGKSPKVTHSALDDCYSLLEIIKLTYNTMHIYVKLKDPEVISFWLSKILESECFKRINFNEVKHPDWVLGQIDTKDNLYVWENLGIYFYLHENPFYDKNKRKLFSLGVDILIKVDKEYKCIRKCELINGKFERTIIEENLGLWSEHLKEIGVLSS